MRKAIFIIIFVLAAVGIGVWGVPWVRRQTLSPAETLGVSAFTIKQTVHNGPNATPTSSTIKVAAGETALDILNRTQDVQVQSYAMGTMVNAINGVVNGTDDKYWLYYVNGAEATTGAADYVVKPKDHIEWRFQGSP